jgi:hypothetical protein
MAIFPKPAARPSRPDPIDRVRRVVEFLAPVMHRPERVESDARTAKAAAPKRRRRRTATGSN